MGTKIPARCSKCKKLGYITNAVEIDGQANRVAQYAAAGKIAGAMFIDCTFISKCECGGDMVSLEGDYVMNSDRASLLYGPESSWEALKELAQVVRDSVAAGESPEKTVERAAEFLPWLSGWKGKLAIYAFNILVGWAGGKALDKAFDSTPPEPPAITLQQLKDAFREELEKAKQDGLLIQPPPPAPASRPSPGVQRHPMLVKFPITAQKLADYEKKSGKVNQFPRGLA